VSCGYASLTATARPVRPPRPRARSRGRRRNRRTASRAGTRCAHDDSAGLQSSASWLSPTTNSPRVLIVLMNSAVRSDRLRGGKSDPGPLEGRQNRIAIVGRDCGAARGRDGASAAAGSESRIQLFRAYFTHALRARSQSKDQEDPLCAAALHRRKYCP